MVKARSSGEDPRATGGLVPNLSHSRVNKTKKHTRYVNVSVCVCTCECVHALSVYISVLPFMFKKKTNCFCTPGSTYFVGSWCICSWGGGGSLRDNNRRYQ